MPDTTIFSPIVEMVGIYLLSTQQHPSTPFFKTSMINRDGPTCRCHQENTVESISLLCDLASFHIFRCVFSPSGLLKMRTERSKAKKSRSEKGDSFFSVPVNPLNLTNIQAISTFGIISVTLTCGP